MSEHQKMNLKVIGDQTMHCGGCEQTVSFALSKLAGVQQVVADYKTQSITFGLNTNETTAAQLQDELRWIGYQTELA